jgi:hypothetical protein
MLRPLMFCAFDLGPAEAQLALGEVDVAHPQHGHLAGAQAQIEQQADEQPVADALRGGGCFCLRRLACSAVSTMAS